MRVIKYEVQNVMKIKDCSLELDGQRLVLVGGKNGQGKSSAIKALLMALCGRSGMDWPEVSLREGENRGMVRVSLSGDTELQDEKGFVVELMLRRKRDKSVIEEFRVLYSTGEEAPTPRDLLRRLYEFRAFDPLAFERAKNKDRVEMLRKLTGLDFESLNRQRKALFDLRTDVNREGKSLAARREALSFPEDTPDEPVDVLSLVRERDDAKRSNDASDRTIKAVADLENDLKDIENKIAKLLEAKAKCQCDLAAAREAAKDVTWVDIDAINQRIESVDEVNRNVQRKLDAKSLDEELSKLRHESAALGGQIDRIDREKEEAIANAKWPVPDMGFDEDGVYLNGLPFEQASKAQRVLASVKVGMALNPKLRLLVCEDGNDLDNDTIQALEKVLEDNDFQMILEFVTRSKEDEDRCCVVFQDGEPKDVKQRTLVPDDSEEADGF